MWQCGCEGCTELCWTVPVPARHPVAFDVDVLLRGTHQIRGPSTSSFRHRPVVTAFNWQYMAGGFALKKLVSQQTYVLHCFAMNCDFFSFRVIFSERHFRHGLLRCRHRTTWLSFRSSCNLDCCLKDLGLWKNLWKR